MKLIFSLHFSHGFVKAVISAHGGKNSEADVLIQAGEMGMRSGDPRFCDTRFPKCKTPLSVVIKQLKSQFGNVYNKKTKNQFM